MNTSESQTKDIPSQTYEKFLTQLKADNFPDEVIDRLKKLLTSGVPVSEANLREALFLESKDHDSG